MTTRCKVFILGTPGDAWRDLAGALVGQLPPEDRDSVVIGSNESCLDDADGLDDVTQRLVFVSGPEAASVLVPGLTEHALTHWIDAARRIRRHLQGHAVRCLAVDAAEARSSFADLAALCRGRFGLAFASPDACSPIKAEPQGDPLHQLLSVILVQSSRQAGPLLEELRHACMPLSNTSTSPSASFDVTRALARLCELEGEVVEARRVAAENSRLATAGDPRILAEMRTENELLLLQLQQAHEQRAMSSTRGGATQLSPTAGAEPVEIEKLVLGSARNEAPHRELTLTLLGLKFGAQRIGELLLRLVEHNGHPGLVIFAAPVQALSGWSESGVDFGQHFMLLVPADEAGRAKLGALSATDWRRLKALADTVEVGIAAAVAEPRWILVAKRLVQQLAELPPELRVDTCRVVGDADGGAWDVALEGVDFEDRSLPLLNLRWTLQREGGRPRSATLQLRLPKAGAIGAPLATWPVSDAGRPDEQVMLSLGDRTSVASRREEWGALSESDRRFVFAILKTLHRLGTGASATVDPALRDAFGWGLAAMVDDVQTALRGTMSRRIVRRLKRLGRPAASWS